MAALGLLVKLLGSRPCNLETRIHPFRTSRAPQLQTVVDMLLLSDRSREGMRCFFFFSFASSFLHLKQVHVGVFDRKHVVVRVSEQVVAHINDGIRDVLGSQRFGVRFA